MNFRRLTSVLLFLFFCVQLPAHKLSKVERKLVKTVETTNPEACDFSETDANNLPQTSATISFTDNYPAMVPTERNNRLLAELNHVSPDLDQGEVISYDLGKMGAADTSFVAKYVDSLDGLGTMGSGAHTPQETVNLNTIEDLTKGKPELIYRLINQ